MHNNARLRIGADQLANGPGSVSLDVVGDKGVRFAYQFNPSSLYPFVYYATTDRGLHQILHQTQALAVPIFPSKHLKIEQEDDGDISRNLL